MPKLVVTNSALMTLHWSSTVGTWSNVLGLVGVPTLPAIDQTLANGLHSDVNTALAGSGILPRFASTTIFERLSIKDISAADRPEFVSVGAPTAGTGAGDVLPLSVAAVLTMRTGVASKSGRGRVYFSGFSEAENDASGRASAAVNTAIKAFIDALAAPLLTRQLQLAVISRPQNAVTIPAKDIPARAGQGNPVTATVARNQKWESQRRRTGRQ